MIESPDKSSACVIQVTIAQTHTPALGTSDTTVESAPSLSDHISYSKKSDPAPFAVSPAPYRSAGQGLLRRRPLGNQSLPTAEQANLRTACSRPSDSPRSTPATTPHGRARYSIRAPFVIGHPFPGAALISYDRSARWLMSGAAAS
ncbi:hypothetical protein EVAR_31184_1 [Eumeta japonica]|uniref:Uncharacterized protein n=1 Tax=Eumeta variegata TaxID=151549 RepID=A0A4C1VXG1_EUMVA|nr:hypothetical protein EVAR_31184_1 [Eumeta japonica]